MAKNSKGAKKRVAVKDMPAKEKKLTGKDMKKVKGGLITEIGMPALDVVSKDASKQTIKSKP